jgi:hypothetical protein
MSVLVLAWLAATPVAAAAQGAGTTPPAQGAGTAVPVVHRQMVSSSPFGLVFRWFNAEYERAITPTTTWGVSGSYFSPPGDDTDFGSANLFYRYYPRGKGFSGFFVGGRGSYYYVSDEVDSGHCFGLGFEIGYTWLLGAKDNFGISLGLGANSLFGGSIEDLPVAIPTIRLFNLGLAF